MVTLQEKLALRVSAVPDCRSDCGTFLEGWIDIRGKFSPEKTNLIQKREGQLCIEYAPGLYFYQKDIDEFILTKAAAHIMVEIMLRESGLELNQADRFYVAGSFGKYVSVESAITIGMYPDMEREKMINAGNSSLEGAQKLLLNKELLADIDQILEEMTYIQFAEVDDFLEQMVAAEPYLTQIIKISNGHGKIKEKTKHMLLLI